MMRQRLFAVLTLMTATTALMAQGDAKEDRQPGQLIQAGSESAETLTPHDASLMLYDNVFADNWFYELRFGGRANWGSNQRHGPGRGRLRAAGGLSVGKWFYPQVGMRLNLMYGGNRGITTNPHRTFHWQSFNFSADGLVSLSNIALGYREHRVLNVSAVFGMGGVQTFGFDKKAWNVGGLAGYHIGPCTMLTFRAGLAVAFRVSDRWELALEAMNTWVDDSFDGVITSNRQDGHVDFTFGIIRHLRNRDGTYRFNYVRRNQHKFDELNVEVNRLRQEARLVREATPDTPVTNRQIHTLVSFKPSSAAIDKMQQVNVFTAVEALRTLCGAGAETRLFISSLTPPADVALFNLRATTITGLLTNTYGIDGSLIQVEPDPAKADVVEGIENRVIVYVNESR